ncbi:hypothetical protein HPB52_004503 [Rhipicephalus sanguineus]|uniref:Uncharacterized protein n=1 Tax=Rhipicephalus sanguineus TaxID=34632 RepID=A0A9D4T3D4_RHISA|nr:hypothetical protein HPB52_004503 [Rhipicephalus sanguineus]
MNAELDLSESCLIAEHMSFGKEFALSFRHIEGCHTGDVIRETFLAEMAAGGVGESQAGSIVCDNAANMNKAFNMTGNFSDDWMHKCPDPEDGNEDCDEECIENTQPRGDAIY